MRQKTLATLLFVVFCAPRCVATEIEVTTAPSIELAFSDSRPSVNNLEAANNALKSIGVRISSVAWEPKAETILAASRSAALDEVQSLELLKIYELDREALLEQIAKAGRTPSVAGGGSLASREEGIPPYPKVYDMKAMSPENKLWAQEKFSKLHVNADTSGVGVDEVMTLISGGPWVWFFLLPDNVTAKLTISEIGAGSAGIRLSYPGLSPHGAFLNADNGIVVAHVIGPDIWVMQYEYPNQSYSEVLETNPWVDYATEQPKLIENFE